MKIMMDPMPKTCSCCPLGRKVVTEEKLPWYTCFITGRTHTSIMTDRPKDCPATENEGEDLPAER